MNIKIKHRINSNYYVKAVAITTIVLAIFVISSFIEVDLFENDSTLDISNRPTQIKETKKNDGLVNEIKIKSQLFSLVNDERKKAGLKQLKESTILVKSAQLKLLDMEEKNYWAHNTPDGKEPWVFISKAGYEYDYVGENLARNFFTAKDIFDAWMISPKHKENILNPTYTEMGIYIKEPKNQTVNQILIVQHFGTPKSKMHTVNALDNNPSRTGKIITYHEWCTGNDISIYENELITQKASDGNTYSMTQGDWGCYEASLKN